MWWLIPLLSRTLGKKGGASSTVLGAVNSMGLGKEGDSDLTSQIAKNQIWGQNELASGMPYDPYSIFANPETQTMGQQTDSLFNELIKKYIQSTYGIPWR